MTALDTPFCDALGVDSPVVQAPIGSATCPELAAAVSDAGGLGTLAVTWRELDETKAVIRRTRERTDSPFGVNLVLDERTKRIDTATHLNACLDAGAEIFSFSFGDASSYVDAVHDAGGVALQTVGSAAEARAAVDAGVDIVVAQGWEAGGHVQSEVATMPLVPRVVDAVPETPVVAAGGIADGRGVAAALALGADGAWLGTRFVASEEAVVHGRYRRRVAETDETGTYYSDLFDKGWPGMPHRVLRNSTVERWEAAGQPAPGDRPDEDGVVATDAEGNAIERYDEALATPDVTGDVEAMALFAGQSAGLVGDARPAGRIVADLVDETEQTLDRLAGASA
ncbi:NAD(P)H-dependent flavin oxidoreductase [Halegenticoccus soli]|uniref:NAD(P)H-dependent flavin oxidoreductase n=1 Tax=Halegenticoccus soli TaxID=1985678 RepID=UPI000C6C8EC3|nr:nitronate monooxygenase [Halegenticoccus soli]